jgi:hypothetical protein
MIQIPSALPHGSLHVVELHPVLIVIQRPSGRAEPGRTLPSEMIL